MTKEELDRLIGFDINSRISQFRYDIKKVCDKYGVHYESGHMEFATSLSTGVGLMTIDKVFRTTGSELREKFIHESEDRTRIWFDLETKRLQKKPWYKYVCKGCKCRVNHPIPGAVCLCLTQGAEEHCQLVKKWIETRKR